MAAVESAAPSVSFYGLQTFRPSPDLDCCWSPHSITFGGVCSTYPAHMAYWIMSDAQESKATDLLLSLLTEAEASGRNTSLLVSCPG